MRHLTIITLIISVYGLNEGHAQPHYPKNFAGSTYNASNPDTEGKKKTKSEEDEKPQVIDEMADSTASAPKKTVISAVQTKDGKEIPIQEDGIEVLKIGGYIDARDTKHFEDSISDLRKVATKYDLGIGDVYGVGNYGWLFKKPELSFTIIARGGKPRIRHSVPKELPIKSSPAWLVTTKLGTVILEGVGPLEDLFSAEGKLVLSKLTKADSPKAEKPAAEAQPAINKTP